MNTYIDVEDQGFFFFCGKSKKHVWNTEIEESNPVVLDLNWK